MADDDTEILSDEDRDKILQKGDSSEDTTETEVVNEESD